jgi:hypothetical protein
MNATPRRARRALLAAAVPAALAATALPAGADAATVRSVGVGPTAVPQIQYTAAPGESNDLRVAFTGTHIHIRDSAPITVGNGCVLDDTGAALCVPGQFQDQYSLGDGRDTMRYLAPHAARVDMGAGDDTYFGALRQDSIGTNGLVVRAADVISGTGNDLVTYRSSSRGVRVTLDGQLNDGDRSEENVRPDVEHVEGSNGIDTLIGSNDADKVEQFSGLGGNDTLEGLDGTDIFNEGSAPSGADTIRGGAGIDRINYAQRTTPVRVDMASLQRNSGAAGEGDFIDPNTNNAIGSRAGDTMIGGSGANEFAGNAGNDTLEGRAGPDHLIGESGVDSLFGGTENDVLDTADNVADEEMSCESGSGDVLNRDLRDVNATGCEIVNSVGILKLAPKAISAEAGEVAKLRLSWTHPKSWKQLRKVTLRLREGGEVVGQVAIRPASGKVEDEGGVRVVHRQSKLTRKGGKVSAQLALRLSGKLADSVLDADVVATDVKGTRQVSRAAGSIQVSD